MASKALVRSVREVSIRKAFGSNSFKGGCAARSDRASYSTSTSALRSGVSAVESPLGEGRIGLKVRVSEKVTQRAYDEAFEELGRSVQFPGFRKKKGGISDPLPRNLILQVVGKKRIAQFVVDGLVTETVCDHAEEMGYKLRDDISASGVVPDIQHVRVSSELREAFHLQSTKADNAEAKAIIRSWQ